MSVARVDATVRCLFLAAVLMLVFTSLVHAGSMMGGGTTTTTIPTVGPNLQAISVTGPTSAAAGQTIAVSASWTNSGDTTMPAGYDVDVVMEAMVAPGGALPPHFPVFHGAGHALDPDESTYVTTSFNIPADAPSGPFLLRLELNRRHLAPEVTDFDNFAISEELDLAGAPVPAPDVFVVELSAPSHATAGGPLSISGKVRNKGQAAADPFGVQISLTTTAAGAVLEGLFPLGRADVSAGLQPATSATFSGTFPIPPYVEPGTYYVAASLDQTQIPMMPGQQLPIFIRQQPISIGASTVASGLPQLVGVDVQPGGRTLLTTASAASQLEVLGHIANRGAGPAGAFGVAFGLSADAGLRAEDAAAPADPNHPLLIPLGRSEVTSGLDAGVTLAVSGAFAIPGSIQPGAYYVAMVVDPDRVVPEAGESDNLVLSAAPISIGGAGGYFDLVNVRLTTLASAATIGETVTVRVVVDYLGHLGPIDVPLAFFAAPEDNPDDVTFLSEAVFTGVSPGLGRHADFPIRIPPLPIVSGPTAQFRISCVLDPNLTLEEPHHNDRTPLLQRPSIAISRPTGTLDLSAATLGEPPASAVPGDRISVSGTVANSGTADLVEPFSVEFALQREPASLTDTYRPPPVPLGRVFVSDGLAHGRSVIVAEDFEVPGFLTHGSYRLSMTVDPDRELGEGDRHANHRVSTGLMQIGVQNQTTNLVAVAVVAPSTGAVGASLAVTGILENRGLHDALRFPVRFALASGTGPEARAVRLGVRVVDRLAAGQRAEVVGSFPVPFFVRPGSWLVTMIVDAGDFVPETDEDDNRVFSSAPTDIATGTGAARGNVVKALFVRREIVRTGPVTVDLPGQSDPVETLSRPAEELLLEGAVQNLTTEPIDTHFALRFFLTRDPGPGDDSRHLAVGESVVEKLAALEVRHERIAAVVPPFLQPGEYFIGMQADPENALGESDLGQGDNLVFAPHSIPFGAEVSRRPDLVADSVFGPLTAQAGAPYAIQFAVRADNLRRPLDVPVAFTLHPISGHLDREGETLLSGGEPEEVLVIGHSRITVTSGLLTTSTTVEIPQDLPEGQYRLGMVVDPEERLTERSGQNNVARAPVPIHVRGAAPQADDHPDSPDNLGPKDRILVGGHASRGALQRSTSPAEHGDTDFFFFDSRAGAEYVVLLVPESLSGAELVVYDAPAGQAPEEAGRDGDIDRGRAGRVRFTASGARCLVRVAARRPRERGTYSLIVREVAAQDNRADLHPGRMSIEPAGATSSTTLAADCSIANSAATSAGSFQWTLSVERHLPFENLLLRPTVDVTVIATGTIAGLDADSAVRLPRVFFGPLPLGSYDLVLDVNSNHDAPEIDDGNDSSRRPFAVGQSNPAISGRLDLAPSGLLIDPPAPQVGNPVRLLPSVASRGSRCAESFTVQVWLDRTSASEGRLVTSVMVPCLSPNSEMPLPPIVLENLEEGEHRVQLVVDAGGNVPEDDETDNVLSREFFVHGAASAGFDLSPSNLAVIPEFPTTSDQVLITLFVLNTGSAPSPACTFQVELDPPEAGVSAPPAAILTSGVVPALQAGEGATVDPVSIGHVANSGSHRLRLTVVGPVAGSPEGNRLDNSSTLDFCVGPARITTAHLSVEGVLRDPSGSPAPLGYRVNVLNEASDVPSSGDPVPSTTGTPGSFRSTVGQVDGLAPAAADGDSLQFQVTDDQGNPVELSEPSSAVLTAGDVERGHLTVNLVTQPQEHGAAETRIAAPGDGDQYFEGEPIEFAAEARSTAGDSISGDDMVWTLDGQRAPLGVGESFATTVAVGEHIVSVSARDGAGTTVTASVGFQVRTTADELAPVVNGSKMAKGGWTASKQPAGGVRLLAVSGEARRARNGSPVPDGVRVRVRNLNRPGADRTGTARGGRFAIVLGNPRAIVAEAGDVLEVTASTKDGLPLVVSPRRLDISRRDLTGLRRNLRIYLAEADLEGHDVALERGLNLLSLPVQPPTTRGAPYDAFDLASELNGDFVARQRSDGRFEVYIPGLSPRFPITGNEGYVVSLKAAAGNHRFSGVPWQANDVNRRVRRGVTSIGYPRGVPTGHDARDLARQNGARFVIRTERDPHTGRGRFGVYLPAAGGSPFPIESGKGYLLQSDRDVPFTLKHTQ
ncbi:MAG: hypothetical protein HY303_04950 [Candidatus Wallbacteria bacterium]|nr:hypothetical protein [Candidatus Wallbacteria bacterium]